MNQANPPPAGAGQAQAGAAANPPAQPPQLQNQVRVQLPNFDGSLGPAAAVRFIRQVDLMQRAGGLDENRTAAAFAMALQGPAAAWLDRLVLENNNAVNNWAQLKPIFKARFVRILSTYEKVQLMNSLVQRPAEQVAEFLDRCYMAHHSKDLQLTDEVKQEAGYGAALNRNILDSFVGGLREDVRRHLANLDLSTATLVQVEQAALNAETIQRYHAPQALQIEETVEAVFRRFGFQRGGPPRRGQGFRRGSFQPRANRAPPSDFTNRKPEVCRRCGLKALHRAQECYVNLEQLQRKNKGKFARVAEILEGDELNDSAMQQELLVDEATADETIDFADDATDDFTPMDDPYAAYGYNKEALN